MTINSTNNEIEYTGNEETTTFVFPYKFFSATDLKVKLDGVLQTGGYGVTGMCSNDGGEIMFDVAPGLGVVINIKREVPATSEFHPTDYNKFPAESVENAIDRAVVLAGQNIGVSPDLSNSLKVPDESGLTFNTVLPAKSIRANKYVMFDSDGNATVGAGGGGSGSGDVSSSISSTTGGKVVVFDGTTGKIIKDTTITGMLKASSGVLTQAISDTDYVSVSAFSTLDGRVGTAETNIGTLESSLTSKASKDLDNISAAGVAVIQSYATGGGADVSLSNLDAIGEARFTNMASIDLDNLSPAGEAKIAGGANTDLSNLSATGQAIIDGKANTNLMNTNFITNGILSAPNGVATYSGLELQLPAGTVLACPNGINADGTRKSIVVTTDSLLTKTTTAINGVWFKAYYNQVSGAIGYVRTDTTYYYEQPTTPTGMSSGALWYNNSPSVNKCYQYNGSAWVENPFVVIADFSYTGGAISGFKAKYPVELLKVSDIDGKAKTTGYIKGFTCVMPFSTTFRFSYGVAEVNGKLLKLSTALNKTMSSWSAGNNGGSLDTGVKQNSKWYFVYAIGKTNDDTAIDIITSLSVTNPLMPSGWDLYRLVDVIYIDASGNVVGYYKFGDGVEVQHNLFSNAKGLTVTTTAQTVTLLFPPIKDRVLLPLSYQIAGASGVVVDVGVDTGSGTDATSQVAMIANFATNLFRNPIVNGNDTSTVRYCGGADVPNFRLVLSSFTFLR